MMKDESYADDEMYIGFLNQVFFDESDDFADVRFRAKEILDELYDESLLANLESVDHFFSPGLKYVFTWKTKDGKDQGILELDDGKETMEFAYMFESKKMTDFERIADIVKVQEIEKYLKRMKGKAK